MSTTQALAAQVTVDERYRLDRLLSSGPGCEDWQATDERLGRPVTIRLVRATAERQLDDLASTVGCLSRLADDRLAQVLDLNVEADPAYVVTECTPGPTVSDLLAVGHIDVALAVELVAEAAAALATAAAAGLHHLRLTTDSVVYSHAGVRVVGTALDAALAGSGSAPLGCDESRLARADVQALGRLLAVAIRPGAAGSHLESVVRRAVGQGGTEQESDGEASIRTPAELAGELEAFRSGDFSLRRHPVRPEAAEPPRGPVSSPPPDLVETGVVGEFAASFDPV